MAPPTLGSRPMTEAERKRRSRGRLSTRPVVTVRNAAQVARDAVDLRVDDALWRQAVGDIDAKLRLLLEIAQVQPKRRSALSTISRMRVALTKI
jgi:hypothetical protein